MNRGLFLISLFFVCISISQSYCQGKDSISVEKIDVVKPYEPSLNKKSKIYVDPIYDDKKINLDIDISYDFESFPVYPQANIETEAKKRKKTKQIKFKDNYATVALGNYMTPLLDFNYKNKAGKNVFNIKADHISSQGSRSKFKDIFGETDAMFSYDRILKSYILNANLSYSNNMLSYYGVPQSVKDKAKKDEYNIYRYYNNIGVETSIDKKNKTKLYFQKALISFNNLSNKDYGNEQNFKTETDFTFPISKEIIHTKLGYHTNIFNPNKTSKDSKKNNIHDFIFIDPSFKLIRDNFNLDMGFSFNYLLGNEKSVKLYPKVSLSYRAYQSYFIPYLKIDGYTKIHSYRSISQVNPFLYTSSADNYAIDTRFNNIPVYISLGMKGIIFSNMDYNFYLSYIEENNFLMFRKKTVEADLDGDSYLWGNAFDVLYDDIYYWVIHFDIKYEMNNRLKRVSLSGKYRIFDQKTVDKVFDNPNININASALYYFMDNLYMGAKVFFAGQRYASANVTKKLDAYLDINLDLNYVIDDSLLVMGRLNNLAGSYEIWEDYHSQGMQFMLGVNYKF